MTTDDYFEDVLATLQTALGMRQKRKVKEYKLYEAMEEQGYEPEATAEFIESLLSTDLMTKTEDLGYAQLVFHKQFLQS